MPQPKPRNEDCAACGYHLHTADGNVCPQCGALDKAIPHVPRYLDAPS